MDVLKNNKVEFCLICCSKVNSSAPNKTFMNLEANEIDNEVTNNLLSKNLSVIFILQKLLKLPKFHLKCNLLEYGHPQHWIMLCDQCTHLTGQAWTLHQQIVQIQHQLNSVKNKLVDKAKSSTLTEQQAENYLSCSLDGNFEHDIISGRKQMWRRTREFIESYDYTEDRTANSLNPFIEGDKLAQYLASQQTIIVPVDPVLTSSSEVEYDVEYNYPDDFNEEYLSPSPSPPPSPLSPGVELEDKFIEKFESETKGKEYYKRKKKASKAPGGHFSCDICGLSYKRNSHLIRHKRIIHKLACKRFFKPEVAYFLCKLCGKEIKTREGLKHHINITHEKRWKFFCEICGMGRPNLTSLKMHLLSKHKEDPITKKMIEKGERIWKCEVEGCMIQFFRKSTLDKHTEKYHGDDGGGEKKFKCDFCDVRFHRRADLKRHGLVHEKKKRNRAHVCDICGKGYGSESYLAIHKQSFH